MKRSFSRAAALAAATVILLINGVIYAWSIYSSPFPELFGWTSAELGLCFTVIMAGFCLGGVLGSALTKKLGAGRSLPIGGVMGAAGFFLCSLLTSERLWLLYIAFAVSSLGVGVVYNTVISSVVARFPDKKGAASGVMMMGFGASSLVLGGLAGKLIASASWQLAYILTGALLLLASLAGTFFIAPPKDVSKAQAAAAPAEGLTTAEMLKTPRFWLLFIIMTFGCAFGSGIIGHARYIAVDAGAAASLATLTVGLLSVCNGLGRVVFGVLHDKKGYKVSLSLEAALYFAAGALAILALHRRSTVLIVPALMLCGLGYGSVPVITSAMVGELFGRLHYGTNFAVMNLNILPAAFASAIAGSIRTAAGSYTGAFWLFLALEGAAALLMLALARLGRKEEKAADIPSN